MSWQDDPIVESAGSWEDDPVVDDAAPMPKRDIDPALIDRSDDFSNAALRVAREGARQVGRAGLNIAEGALALPQLAGNAVTGLVDKGLEAIGSDARLGPISVSRAVDPQGLLAPQSRGERYTDAITRGVSGAATGIGVGSLLAGAASPVAAGVGNALQASPTFQAASATTGATASQGVRDAGGGPLLQALAGFVGGATPYGLVEGTKALARGSRALVEPFTEAGRNQVVGRTLNQTASDPVKAQANLAAAKEIVPGSKPTVAEVSKDYGLISAQRAARTRSPEEFALRSSQQNTARQEYLDVAAKDQPALTAAITRRDKVTTNLRELAFNQAKGKAVDSGSITANIDKMLKSPDNAGSRTQQALKYAKDEVAGKDDIRSLYAVRKEISDVIAGKVDSEKSFLRYTGGELIKVRELIDDAIQSVAPAWKPYLTKYRQLSKPIERMEAIQEAQGKAGLASSDALTGREVLSQAKFKTQAKALAEAGVLTKGQRTRVQQIADDLDRGMSINDPNIRAIGSNTTQDMTAANVIGQALGSTKLSPFIKTITRPLQWIYRVPEQQLQDLLTEAMLDPATASALMKGATGANLAQVSKLLRQRFQASVAGTTAGQVTQQSAPQESSRE